MSESVAALRTPHPLRVLVFGPTPRADIIHVTAVLYDLHDRLGIATLLADNVDGAAAVACGWAEWNAVPVEVPGDWTDSNRPDLAIVFADASDGSDVIRQAQKAGVPVLLVPMAGEVP